jgi:predicted O-methyltransferase YrrM
MNVPPVISRPKLLIKYLLRERNLENLLQLRKGEAKEYLREADRITGAVARLARKAALGAMLSQLRGPIVYACVRTLKPAVMVETGVASGSSTCYILSAMNLNQRGQLYSIDLPNADREASLPRGKEIGWLVSSDIRQRWKLVIGRSQEKLPLILSDLKCIDAFLHDSEHTYETMMFEYETAWRHMRNGGMLLSDDVHWNSAFNDFIRVKKPVRWMTFDGLGVAVK